MLRKNYKISMAAFILLVTLCVSCGYTQKTLKTISTNPLIENDKNNLASAVSFQNILRKITQSLKPSVVNIQVTTKPSPATSLGGDRMMDELLRRFFGRDFNGGGSDPNEEQGGTAVGSGFIISTDGYIVTNAHVANNAKNISVTLEDRTVLKADLIGLDTKTDIAILKINNKKPLIAAPLGDSDAIEPGDFAVAIGNPFGLTGTLTFGIISAKGRNSAIEENAAYKNYIQTDVPINPGNSGGPLINIRGQVIGLNSAIFSTSGGSIGIGFAIPINIVKNVVNQLIHSGHVTRGAIGAIIGPISQDMADAVKLKDKKGVIINDVMDNTPAQKAGLQIWDIVRSVNGQPIDSPADFLGQISRLTPGEKAVLGVLRDGKELKITITISNKDFSKNTSADEDGASKTDSTDTSLDWQGLTLMNVADAKQTIDGIPSTIPDGVMVTKMEASSKATEQGVAPGDILVTLDKVRVKTIKEVKNIVKRGKIHYLQFKSARMGRNLLVVLP